MGLMEPSSQTCDECGSGLELGSDRNGFSLEWCSQGCFTPRQVRTRRPPCPECQGQNWTSTEGCRDCGHEWVIRACPWDGTVVYWRPLSATLGQEVVDAA